MNFPGSEAGIRPNQSPHRSTYLPFRRISLPSAPSSMLRQSVVSVASFDSLPEDEASPSLMRSVNGSRGISGRPTSIESPRRRVRRRDSSVKPVENSHGAKRQKVVEEFHATEKVYVGGLELIYSVKFVPLPYLAFLTKAACSTSSHRLSHLLMPRNLCWIVQHSHPSFQIS